MRGLTENLISYALGRAFGFPVRGALEEILAKAQVKSSTPRAVIQALVASQEFHRK